MDWPSPRWERLKATRVQRCPGGPGPLSACECSCPEHCSPGANFYNCYSSPLSLPLRKVRKLSAQRQKQPGTVRSGRDGGDQPPILTVSWEQGGAFQEGASAVSIIRESRCTEMGDPRMQSLDLGSTMSQPSTPK